MNIELSVYENTAFELTVVDIHAVNCKWAWVGHTERLCGRVDNMDILQYHISRGTMS